MQVEEPWPEDVRERQQVQLIHKTCVRNTTMQLRDAGAGRAVGANDDVREGEVRSYANNKNRNAAKFGESGDDTTAHVPILAPVRGMADTQGRL